MSTKLQRFPSLHYDHVRKYVPLAMTDLALVRRAYELLPVKESFVPSRNLAERGQVVSIAILVEAMFWYERFGQQNYVLDRRVQDLLNNTSLENVPKEAIVLPYPSIYVVTEDSSVKVYGGPTSGWHQMAGFWFVRSQDGLLYIWMWGKPKKGPRDDASFWMRFDLDAIYEEHGGIEAYIKYSVENYDMVLDKTAVGLSEEERKASVGLWLEAARLAFNLVMYLQTHNLDQRVGTPETRQRQYKQQYGNKNPNKGKAKLAHRDLLRAGEATVTYLGTRREWREKVAVGRAGGRSWWVPGHWQRYWVGPKGDQRQEWRLKEPYLHGREASEQVPRRFYVPTTED